MAATHRVPLWKIPAWLPVQIQTRFPELKVVHLEGYQGLDTEIVDAEIYSGFILPPASLALARANCAGSTRRRRASINFAIRN